MHLVEGGAALQQLAERWKRRGRWAFTLLHAAIEPAQKGLVLPPLPGKQVCSALPCAITNAEVDLQVPV